MFRWQNVLFIFLLVSSILAVVTYLRLQDFEQNTQRIAEQSVKSGAAETARVVADLRRRIALFAEEKRDLLLALAGTPSDKRQYERLTTDLRKHFPNFFAVTLADNDGKAILEGLDDLVGNGCRRDIKKFVGHTETHGIYIHSSPQQNPHHFDIMVPFHFPSGEEGVFFVSFYAELLASILNSIEVPNHNLYLTITKRASGKKEHSTHSHENWDIEVSSEGARDVINRELVLSAAEQGSKLAMAMPEGTRWHFIDIPDTDLFANHTNRILLETLLIELILLGLSLLILRQSGNIETIKHKQVEAELANQAKSNFLSMISHELRTPMNAIIGMTQNTLETPLDKFQKSALQKSLKASYCLLDIIEDTLTYATINADSLATANADFRLQDVISDISKKIDFLTTGKQMNSVINISDNVPDYLEGDSRHLRMVLYKLVENAVKFSRTGDTIEIGLQVKSNDNSGVILHFSIHDTGIGIKPKQQKQLFQPFSQLDGSSTRKHGGMGLGLMLSKRLVESMDGEIWLESEYQKGSTFHFTARFQQQPEYTDQMVDSGWSEIEDDFIEAEINNLSQTIDTKQLTPILNSLLNSVRLNQFKAIEIARELETLLDQTEYDQDAAEIGRIVQGFDFEQAEKKITLLANKAEITLNQ